MVNYEVKETLIKSENITEKEVALEKEEIIIEALVEESPKKVIESNIVKEKEDILQIDFTMLEKESLLSEIANIEVMTMTPLDAMNTLFKIVQDAKKLK